VIVCASSAAMALIFDAGGDQQELLIGRLNQGGYKAMDLVRTCQRYAVDAKQAPKAQKADMEKRARKEVIQGSVQDRCGNTGKDTLKKLVANRKAGIEKGAEGCDGATGRKHANTQLMKLTLVVDEVSVEAHSAAESELLQWLLKAGTQQHVLNKDLGFKLQGYR
ncbi:hypothetical protein AK812_SmicGene31522, partial [Symbiodinium microadriaticum]